MTPVHLGLISGIFKLVGSVLKAVGRVILAVFKLLSVAIIYAVFGVVLYAIWEFNPFDGSTYAVIYLVGFGLSVVLSFVIAYKLSRMDEKKDKATEKNEAPSRPLSWFEKRKLKKEQEAEAKREEALKQERLMREEELREQERKLEELKAERLQAEILREERLIAEYRRESANAALRDYEQVVSPHPILNAQEEEINYFGAPQIANKEPKSQRYEGEMGYSAQERPTIYMSAVEENTLIHEYADRFEVYRLNGGEKVLDRVEYKR